jgi:hypothetical protein
MLNTSKPLKKHLKCTRTPKEKGCCGVKSVDFFENKKQGTIRSSKRKYQCMEWWDLDIKGVRLEW